MCIHRVDTDDECAVVLDDVADVLAAAFEAHFREAGILTRLGSPASVAKSAVAEAFAALNELAIDRTIRL
jgi:hypothetical protein